MTKLHDLLFPQLSDKNWTKVNLNAMSLMYPFRDVAVDYQWTVELNKALSVDYSWGGWMEYRGHLLRKQYMKNLPNDHFWHLGVDYNVPDGTEVHLPVDAELIFAGNDNDQQGGWGGKMIFKTGQGHFILGHLGEMTTELRNYNKGEIVGRVGEKKVNGGWFPHLHVQCVVSADPYFVDGYSYKFNDMERIFPNPEIILPQT